MSDSLEEQTNNTSVLGRIGSWLWARSPISSTENASLSSGPAEDQPDPLTEDVFYPVSQPDGQPSSEETVEDEWEEASSSFQNSTQNISHFPQTQCPSEVSQERQAQAGKRLHVYLEETSVSGSAGQQEVVCKFSKSLHVRPKSRFSISLDSEKEQSYSSALIGVNLNFQKEEEEMGRKNARRRYWKNSQGDSVESGKVTQTNKELTDKDKTQSPKSKAETSPAPNPTPAPSPALPEQLKSHPSGPGCLNSSQDNSSSACGEAAQAESVEGEAAQAEAASMEGDDSFYRVERKTETPESKRRSMKVSKSEVKLFPKNVALQRSNDVLRATVARDEDGEEVLAEIRLKEAKKPEDKLEPASGRILDKIGLFESRKPRIPPKSTDVSPIRQRTARPIADSVLSEQRCQLEERLKRRSSSSSPPRQKALTIKERIKNLNDVCEIAMLDGLKSNIPRIPRKITTSKSLEILDLPDQLDANNKAVLQFNRAESEANAGKVESPELTKNEKTRTNENTDASDLNKTPIRTGSRNKKRRSPRIEKNVDSFDGKTVEDGVNVAMQVAESVSQEAIAKSGNVKDSLAKKHEVERTAKVQLTKKKSESSKMSKQAGTKRVGLETFMEDVQNNVRTILSSPVKAPREDAGNRQDSFGGHDEFTQQGLLDKESKTLRVSTEKSQVKLFEKVAGKELAKCSSEQGDLHNKGGNASTNTQEKDAVTMSDNKVQESKENGQKNYSNVPMVKQEKSIVQQKAISLVDCSLLADTNKGNKATGKKQDLSSTKQANSCVVDNAESQLTKVTSVSNKTEDNIAQEFLRESKQDAPCGKLEKAVSSREQKPRHKLKNTSESVNIGSSNEEQKCPPVTEAKVDLSSTKGEGVTTSGNQKAHGKLEATTSGRDELTLIKVDKNIPCNKSDVIKARVKLTKDIIEENKNLSNAKNELGEVQKSAELQQMISKQDAILQLDKDVARPEGTENKSAHLSVSKGVTCGSFSFEETKASIDESPAILFLKDQEIAVQNSASLTKQTDGLVKEEKEWVASIELPMEGQNELEPELPAAKLQSKQDAEPAMAGLIKQAVIQKGGKVVQEKEASEIETSENQALDNGGAQLELGASVPSPDEKTPENLQVQEQGNASKMSPKYISPPSVGAENNAPSVMDNKGKREGRMQTITSPSLALTKSTKIHGKETEPKPSVVPKPQAEEKNSQTQPDDSAEKSGPVTTNRGALTVSKNDIPEHKDFVEKASKAQEVEKDRNYFVGANKMSSESPQLARDLMKQASIECKKAITNMGPGKELVATGNVMVLPKQVPLKNEAVGGNKQSFKIPPEASKFLDSSRKSKGKSKDDWRLPRQQDAPSSWLDVDFPKQKLKVPHEAKLTSSGSESNLLDTSEGLDDEDFVEKIKKLCAPFQLPLRKHNPFRPPQPAFAMPAIKEDRFEKTFDPGEFTFGLRKKNKFSLVTPSLSAKLQSSEGKTSIKPARASLSDRSMLLSGLESRLRDKTNGKEEHEDETRDEVKVKSRLEGSCVLSSLTTSSFRSKLGPSQAQAEGSESGIVSQSNSPPQQSPQQMAPPPLPLKKLNPEASHKEEEVQSAEELVVNDSGPQLLAFTEIKLPCFLEKYLLKDAPTEAQIGAGREQRVNTEACSKMPLEKEEALSKAEDLHVDKDTHLNIADVEQLTLNQSTQNPPEELHVHNKAAVKIAAVSSPTVGMNVKEIQKLPHHFAGISQKDKAPPPPRRRPSKKIQPAKGFHKRPGKMVLFEKASFEGQRYEVHRDIEDASSLLLSPLISVRVVRGCWVLYEKPGFQGRTIAVEEGSLELANVWTEPRSDFDVSSDTPMQIGSIRLAVADYSVPRIDLFTEPEGRGRVTPYHDDVLETGSFGIPLNTASIQVHSGVWLVFSDPGFQGMLAVLESGVYPFPETWGFPSPFVGSLRPLKMGGFKVENPNDVKAVLYENAFFEGPNLAVEADIFSFGEEEADGESSDCAKLQTVASLKVHGGLWVGYSEPGFNGQQYILEEGEYQDSGDWGGAEILSIRPIMADFLSPHLKMFSDRDFGKLGVNIDLTVPVVNLEETGYGLKTQSMDVYRGVWAVFEEAGFCGESYIVEKGQYGSPEDWGATRPSIASCMPVLLENFENTAKFKVQLFSETDFKGSSLILEDSEGFLPNDFTVASCKVLAGSWLAFEGRQFLGEMYVLDEGFYPDLRAMGCVHADVSILSMQIIGFDFSVPSIVLFERSGLKGKRVVLSGGVVNLQTSGGGGRIQSVLVEGGM